MTIKDIKLSVTENTPMHAHKGIGACSKSEHKKKWNLLNEDVSLPAAVIYQSKLNNNIKWMQSFADKSNVKLAPHGKTTMVTGLFKKQLSAGAWGISLASAPQVAAAYLQGVSRILMVNQLIGKRNMEIISSLVSKIEFYCVVDSAENVHQLGKFFSQSNSELNVLIEIGAENGRCGCRTIEQVIEVNNAISQYDCIHLAGVEVYEGIIHGEGAAEKIAVLLGNVISYTRHLIAIDAFDNEQIILTGAGSVWYDLVSEHFTKSSLSRPVIPIIRPGCYITHDVGVYEEAQKEVYKRNQLAHKIEGQLEPCLEVWAYVQSLPEPGLAIVGMGKRDVAFDAGFPKPSSHYSPSGGTFGPASENWTVTELMDQHTLLCIPIDSKLKVGDIITFSISHPCLTFDKWRWICVVDDNFNVVECLSTDF